jgi:putrescine transport system ATP-binding protein
MNHGRIVQVATPAEIYEQPNSRYVADFIGNINLIEGKVAAVASGATRIDAPDAGAVIELDQPVEARVGDPVWFAIRPEKVRISLDAPLPGSPNTLPGEVWDIGYLGDVSIYHVRLASGATVTATVTNQTRVVERPITWEDKVWLTWSRDGGVVLTK